MKPKVSNNLIIAMLLPLAVGILSSLFSDSAVQAYDMMEKPAASPPAYLFPIVWTVLYLLMGISSYLIYRSDSPYRNTALTVYAIQLLFNFFWSIIFFTFSAYLFAFVWLVIMILLIILMIFFFYKIDPAAAFLQIPYLLWCLFAAYLNLSVYLLN
ncbi:MAG: tryptophan-rich sensory protein [Lachnospiraceae bacterium]|nr:tryptophan-rich sensory protein [Lachnospiraceae bacterium]